MIQKVFAFILICASCYVFVYTIDKSLEDTRPSVREFKMYRSIVCLTSLGTLFYLLYTV